MKIVFIIATKKEASTLFRATILAVAFEKQGVGFDLVAALLLQRLNQFAHIISLKEKYFAAIQTSQQMLMAAELGQITVAAIGEMDALDKAQSFHGLPRDDGARCCS